MQPDEQSLAGWAELTATERDLPATLRLTPRAEILAVESAGRPLPFTFRNGRLTVGQGGTAGVRHLKVIYRAVFDDPLPPDTVGVEDPSFGVGATILAAGAFLSAGTPWFPQADGVRGRHHVSVGAPAGMLAVTAGRFHGSRDEGGLTISTWENEFPLIGLALAAGRYQVAEAELDGIQLLTFLSPQNAPLAPGYLDAMRRHLAFYRDRLGPYPFSKFAVVENFLPTGFGLPSWTLLGKSVVRLPFLLDTSLPHEIVHSWWGNAVEIDYARGNWGEGLATYLADYLLKERADPTEAFDYRRKLLRDYSALVTPRLDFPLSQFTGRAAKYQQAVGYGKGAMIFHMLRGTVGDQAFWSSLRRMAVEGSGKTLSWQDIERIFADTARQDLRWFFAQWVERPGAPELSLDEVRAVRTGDAWLVSGVLRQHGGAYRLAVPLRLTTADGESREQVVSVTGPRTPFRFSMRMAPQSLVADPDSHLFRRLSPSEIPATVNDLLTPVRPLVIVARGHDRLLEAARDLLKGVQWNGAEVTGEAALGAADLAGRDVLYLGWPTRRDLQPALPPGLEIRGAAPPLWRIQGETQSSDVLFAVLTRNEGVRAVLLATEANAAQAVAARISHYGRYSLLQFGSGRNLTKSTWQPLASPLTIDFSREPQR